MKRPLVWGAALAFFCVRAYGQLAVQDTPNFPVKPPVLRQYSLNPQPASGVNPAFKIALPFRNWQDILKQDAAPVEVSTLTPRTAERALSGPGQCSVPLLRMPVPEHIDDQSVMTPWGNMDGKIVIQPPPDCPLRGSQAEARKRK